MRVFILPSWYVTTYNPLNAIFFKEQAVALAKSKINVTVIAPALISLKEIIASRKFNFGIKRYFNNGVTEYIFQFPRIPYFDRINHFIRLIIGKILLKKAIREQGLPNISHVHSYQNGALAFWLKKKFNIPYVITEHNSAFISGNISNFHKKCAELAFSFSSKNIAVSKILADSLQDQFSDSFVVIPNIVNTEYFTPFHKSTKSPYTFLNVAHLNENKNQEMLINSFAEFNKVHNESILFIIGGGEQMYNLKKLINFLNLSDHVQLLGYADRDKVREYMQCSDCFILSSFFETFGIVLIVAMSCGLPVISTKSGGPNDIVLNDDLGVLCDHTNQSLLDAMLIVKEKNYSSELIRDFACENFSEKTVVSQIIQLYKECI